jgi:uncharacterized protein YkwD
MKVIEKTLMMLIVIAVVSCHINKKEIEDEDVPDEIKTVYNLDPALMLRLINEQRIAGCKCGDTDMPPVPVIKWNRLLAKAAYDHSVDMDTHRLFNHTSFDGRSPGDRIKATGYNTADWAENIANGYSTEQSVIKGWMQSPGHCTSIMNKNYTEVGVGRKANYWTMVLARPR